MNYKSISICLSILFAFSAPAFSFTNQIGNHIKILQGPINGVFIHINDKTLVVYGDPREIPTSADTVLLTHHRRDVAWAGAKLVEKGAASVGPEAEADHFQHTDRFWDEFQQKRFHDYYQQTTKILASPIHLSRTVSEGDTIEWESLSIRVISTPGYTRGAVSYLIDIKGKTIAFTGDLMYGDGRIFDWYSLQDAIPEAKIGGYHGYAGRTAQLIKSLKKIADLRPDIIVPVRGPAIYNVQESISRLITRLQKAYENYLSIDALRWYFGDEHIQTKAERVIGSSAKIDWMPFAETLNDTPPDWIIPISNARLILAEDGSGFLVDCGSERIINEIKKLHEEGKLKSLDGLFITHYHNDHNHQAMDLVREFHCPVYATKELLDILENPGAYRLPCLTENPMDSIRVMKEGETIDWKEFKLTFSYHPGQTILHDSMLVEKDTGERIFFIGDSFTPAGIDDYCLQNRNLLHPNYGYFYCLNVLKRMEPNYLLINQHVVPTFRFSEDQLDHMLETLDKRIDLYRDLFPWDDPNYGLDEGWARFYPYAQTVKTGESFDLKLKIFNHSPKEQYFRTKINLPEEWDNASPQINFGIPSVREAEAQYNNLTVPQDIKPGVYIITADIQTGEFDLREWTEAMVIVEASHSP